MSKRKKEVKTKALAMVKRTTTKDEADAAKIIPVRKIEKANDGVAEVKKSGKGSQKPKKDDRVLFAVKKIADGSSDLSLVGELRDEFGIGRKQALSDIRSAENFLEEISNKSVSAGVARSLAMREEIIMRAMLKEDYRIALSALDSKEKLVGLGSKENSIFEQAVKNIQEVAELAASEINE